MTIILVFIRIVRDLPYETLVQEIAQNILASRDALPIELYRGSEDQSPSGRSTPTAGPKRAEREPESLRHSSCLKIAGSASDGIERTHGGSSPSLKLRFRDLTLLPYLRQPRRGEIWFVRFPTDPADEGERPVVIVSTDARNLHEKANTVLVVPLSTTPARAPTHKSSLQEKPA